MKKSPIRFIKTCFVFLLLMLVFHSDIHSQATVTTLQSNVTAALPGNTNVPIVVVKITVTTIPYSLYALFLSTAGSSNAATDIANAKVFYTGNSNVFSTSNQFSSTINSPNGFFTAGAGGPSFTLLQGDNYFWITYDVQPAALACDYLDAACSSVYGSNGTMTPAVTDPAGSCIIENCPTGIQTHSEEGKSNLKIYPNPSDGNFTIEISDEIKNPGVEIFNVFGKKIFEESRSEILNKEIHMRNVSAGIYFAVLRNSTMLYIQKIVAW